MGVVLGSVGRLLRFPRQGGAAGVSPIAPLFAAVSLASLVLASLFSAALPFLSSAHAAGAGAAQSATGDREQSARAAGTLLVVKGTLITSKCMNKGKLKACYLWWYDPKSLVLFTDKRTLYDLRFVDVPQWKLDKGYAKQVAVKAVRDGEKLVVYDVLPLEGGGKISKACL